MITTLIFGGITHHYFQQKLNYCNKINKVGTIKNNYTGILIGNKKAQIGIMKGRDSACAKIKGILSSLNFSKKMSFMIGGYNANFKEFRDRSMEPPSIGGITPVIGLNYKLPIYKTNTTKISLDTLFSIGIVTHALSVTF